MKVQLIAIVAAVLVVGCGETQQSAPAPEAKPEPPTAEAPDISIHDAAGFGNIEAVKQHLAAGADVNAGRSDGGGTPLHFAANVPAEVDETLFDGGVLFGGAHKKIVELLLDKGADVNAKNNDGWTSLHGAAAFGKNEIADLLITSGADVNAMIEDGWTPLDLAIQVRNTELAELLRKHGGKTGRELKAEGK